MVNSSASSGPRAVSLIRVEAGCGVLDILKRKNLEVLRRGL
jgi:hypothetical protein